MSFLYNFQNPSIFVVFWCKLEGYWLLNLSEIEKFTNKKAKAEINFKSNVAYTVPPPRAGSNGRHWW